MLEQQDTEIAYLHTKNTLLAPFSENATQTMEQRKAALMNQIRVLSVLSSNHKQQKVVLTTQIRALSAHNDNQVAEIEHLWVRFESHMKLQN